MGAESEERIETLRRALRERREPVERLTLLAELSRRTAQADPTDAIEAASEALEIAQRLGDRANVARCLNTIGLAHASMAQFDAALEYLAESLELCRELNLYRGLIDGCAQTGNILLRIGRPVEAREFLRQADEVCTAHGDPEHGSGIRNSLALLCYRTGDYVGALETHQKNLDYLESVGNRLRAALVMGNIAIIHGELGDHARAAAALERVLEMHRTLDDPQGEALALVNLSEHRIHEGNLKGARECVERALRISEELPGTHIAAWSTWSLARLLAAEGEDERALEVAVRAAALAERVVLPTAQAPALLEIGAIHARRRAYRAAIDAFDHAFKIGRASDNPVVQADAALGLAQAYEHLGEIGAALEHYRRYMALKESLVGEEKRRAILALEVRLAVEKAEREREMFRFRTEQLEADNAGKVRELTVLAMNLTHTREIVRELEEHARELRTLARGRIRQVADLLSRKIDEALRDAHGWESFERQFNLLHPEFMRSLSERYPTLTPTERRVCLLLRINLASKEIADLLNISIRAVEGHRYNIRRKLGLPTSASLSTFLASL